MKLWRQGDIYISRVQELPTPVTTRGDLVLAHGEMTGHSHRVADKDAAVLFAHASGELYLNVRANTSVVHDEHAPIALVPGFYRVWRQREYTPEAIRTVVD